VNSLVQLITTNEMRGRVMSVYTVAFRAACRWEICCRDGSFPCLRPRVVLSVNGFLIILVALYFLLIQRGWLAL